MTTFAKPLLIYDGDCTFCAYWAHYWQKLTGNRVDYRPYQEVADDYPQISIESFQRAVQYVAEDGTISSAAKASFLTLSHADGKAFWLWLYRWLPGFALITEWMYAVIAAHRGFFYKITLLLWGRDFVPPQYGFAAWLFLRALGIVYLIAFFSFGIQALGLIGHQGIIPVPDLVAAGHQQLGHERYWYIPMLFWINQSDFFIQFVCWAGGFSALLLIANIFPRLNLTLLYLFYLSLISAGQVFMTFQWDLFLLESGILAIILITSTHLGIWLIRWLLFRFIFAAGVVKIMSGDPAWRDFSSLAYYFFTEPLPTPLAWYAHYLPSFILTFGTIATLIIELAIPFLIFFPRRLRFFSGFCILLLQVTILLTGNYNFFNLLTIVLCLALFDDLALKKLLPRFITQWLSKRAIDKKARPFSLMLMSLFAGLTILLSIIQFQMRFLGTTTTPLLAIQNYLGPLHLVSTYGPFAVITKERMEIIIEGSPDGEHWQEYAFKYKPGDIYRRPLWNIPLQPRLDWQMWFAALAPVNANPWFLQFMQRLLENSPPVLALLEYNPFPKEPPQYVRALFYDYRFSTPAEKEATGAWWQRQLIRFYLPEVRLK